MSRQTERQRERARERGRERKREIDRQSRERESESSAYLEFSPLAQPLEMLSAWALAASSRAAILAFPHLRW
mgnify:CR=1 FL=1